MDRTLLLKWPSEGTCPRWWWY